VTYKQISPAPRSYAAVISDKPASSASISRSASATFSTYFPGHTQETDGESSVKL
jgi:hypothetical protein